ncbi:MAG: cell wall-binding repeat-containing protein [Coriobacteriia bacterium]|nr:cell wall-binding repeat-containing protein [Coriobacteriia bacterium]
MTRKRVPLAAVAAALMLAILPTPATAIIIPTFDDMFGYVTDAESGAKLSGVSVDLKMYDDYFGYNNIASTTTNSTGRYAFNGLPDDYYDYCRCFRVASTRYRSAITYTYYFKPGTSRSDVALRRVAERVAGSTRYSTAVAAARKGYDPWGNKSWDGATDVIIASGEDRAAADPLAAAGLCWAYDAPLFLVSSTSVPAEVKQAVQEIVTANGAVTVHLVGGKVSVPDARYAELDAAVSGTLSKHRVLATGSRYDLAAKIAQIVVATADSDPAKDLPPAVLVANGADPTKFFDALALSPISAAKGCPIVLTSASSLPSPSANAIKNLGFNYAIIGGGPNTVGANVMNAVDDIVDDVGGVTQRWYGQSRYTTATTIAEKAQAKGWLDFLHIGVAAKLPDALAGGSAVGRLGGVLVLTRGDALTSTTAAFLEKWDTHNNAALGNWSMWPPITNPSLAGATYVLGGKLSITDAVQTDMIDALAMP